MRYVESVHGILLAPRRHASHGELAAGLSRDEMLSAGFLAARYEASAPWQAYGQSTGLSLKSRAVSIPSQLWVGIRHWTLVYSDNPKLLEDCSDVVRAEWGMSEEGWEGTCAVYAPLHPRFPLSADAIVQD